MIVAPLVSTTYTVVETITATGCTNTNSVLVTVDSLPVPGISDLTSVCQGSQGVTYTTERGMIGYAWVVSPGGVITSGSATNEVTVNWPSAGAQTVSVNYITQSGCTAAVATTKSLTVDAPAGAAGEITGTSQICSGTKDVSYAVAPIANATSYVWGLPAGAAISSGDGTSAITVNFNENASSGNISVYGNNAYYRKIIRRRRPAGKVNPPP